MLSGTFKYCSYHIWSGIEGLSEWGAGGEGYQVGGVSVYGATLQHAGAYQCTPYSDRTHVLTVLVATPHLGEAMFYCPLEKGPMSTV